MIIDYYNDFPKIIEVIDKLNDETIKLKEENNKLKNDLLYLFDKYKKELKEYKSINELKLILLEITYEKKKRKKKKYYCF